MKLRWNAVRDLPRIFWVCSAITVIAWVMQPGYQVGWDLHVYKAAVVAMRFGHDPYADAVAIQRAFHVLHPQPPYPPGLAVPFCYVYSPLTLLPLRVIVAYPSLFWNLLYWTLYAICVLAAVAVGFWATRQGQERTAFIFLVPAAVFFPGLLQQDVLFSGNIAYIFYGLTLGAAWLGWRKGDWLPFYTAVVLASCYKAPLLYLLAIPVLSARRQWLQAGIAGAVGVGLFAMQPVIWPSLFHNYLTAVDLQFLYNRDFSSSPVGLLSDALFNVVPYKITTAIVYPLSCAVFGLMLLYLRQKFLAGYLTLKQWVPVMLVGVALLNMRIMEYDVAPLTTMMALAMWRVFARNSTLQRTVLRMALFFVLVQLSMIFTVMKMSAVGWRLTECVVLLFVFVAGFVNLYLEARDSEKSGSQAPL